MAVPFVTNVITTGISPAYTCTYVLDMQEHICMNVLYCCSHAHTYMHVYTKCVKQGTLSQHTLIDQFVIAAYNNFPLT